MKKTKNSSSRIHGVVTVGERGQVVIPAEAREMLGVVKGDKLIAFSGDDGMLVLAKVDHLKEKIDELSKFIKPL